MNTVNRKDEVVIVLSADDNYAPYLAATLASLAEHSSPVRNYVAYVLTEGISDSCRKRLLTMETDHVKVRFVDIRPYLKNVGTDAFFTSGHMTRAAYYRCFIPELFAECQKAIYCDCDAIFLDDPAKLYEVDLDGKMLAAVKDAGILAKSNHPRNVRYYHDELGLGDLTAYFNSGLLVFNIPECQKRRLLSRCMENLKKIKSPRLWDQDLLNVVCEGRVVFLDWSWNLQNHVLINHVNLETCLDAGERMVYLHSLSHPKFLHYTSYYKPWKNPSWHNADIFWHYARMTPFYEEMLFGNLMRQPQKYIAWRFKLGSLIGKCLRYKILSGISSGERREKYRRKLHRMKNDLAGVRRFFSVT